MKISPDNKEAKDSALELLDVLSKLDKIKQTETLEIPGILEDNSEEIEKLLEELRILVVPVVSPCPTSTLEVDMDISDDDNYDRGNENGSQNQTENHGQHENDDPSPNQISVRSRWDDYDKDDNSSPDARVVETVAQVTVRPLLHHEELTQDCLQDFQYQNLFEFKSNRSSVSDSLTEKLDDLYERRSKIPKMDEYVLFFIFKLPSVFLFH